MSYQRIIVVGNLGHDPEMRYLPSGQAVTNFNLASNRQYTSSTGERVKETTWFRVSAWGRQAETCKQYLKTGSMVLVEGRLNPDKETGGPRVYEKKGGSFGASYEITAERVVFMSSSDGSSNDHSQREEILEEDEIPF